MTRFNLKRLLTAVALIAVVLAVYPRVSRYVRWHDTRNKLEAWKSKLNRQDGKFECYQHMNLNLLPSNTGPGVAGHSFMVSTAEPDKRKNPDGSFGWVFDSEVTIDPTRFYVIPPGKWVDSIDGVIETWDNYRHKSFEQ